jgi:hypothetical protein
MPTLHKNITASADIHNPKWFPDANNGDVAWRNEKGELESTDELVLPAALNFVDASVAPPTTNDGDIYVLSSGGSVNAGWGAVSLDDWVRYDLVNTTWNSITPQKSSLCYDKTADKLFSYDGVDWLQVGGDSIYTASGTVPTSVVATLTDTFTFKGNNTSSASSNVKIVDSASADLWDFRNNGDVYQSKNSIHYAQGNSLTFDTGDGSFTGLRIKAGHNRGGTGENDLLFQVRDNSDVPIFTVGNGTGTSSTLYTKASLTFSGASEVILPSVSNFIFDVQTIPVWGTTGTRLRNTAGIRIDENTYINKVASSLFCFDITGTTLGAFTSVNDFATATENQTRGFFSNDLTSRFLAFDDGGNIRIKAVTTTTADAELVASEMSFHIDESGNNLTFKVKYSDGTTVKSGSVALT